MLEGLANIRAAPCAATRQLLVVATALTCIGCGSYAARELTGAEVPVPQDFSFVGDMSPCYLELVERSKALAIRPFW